MGGGGLSGGAGKSFGSGAYIEIGGSVRCATAGCRTHMHVRYFAVHTIK